MVENLNCVIKSCNDIIWGWPLIIFVVGVSVLVTIALHGIQFRNFIRAWRLTLQPSTKSVGDMTSFQAFLNALSISLGNGSLAGMATAIYAGGPGAAFWVFVVGLLSMALRFAEVFLGTYYPPQKKSGMTLGGPMMYLTHLPGGRWWASLYAFFLLFLGLAAGAGMQSNSIKLGLVRTFGLSPLAIALIIVCFAAYVLAGGARRIVAISDTIVPIKVILFFSTSLIVLGYHYQSLIPALITIITNACCPQALAGASVGLLVGQAMRFGISRSINASEAGLGSAAVFFGGTGDLEPEKNGTMSMLGVFISANLVCFMVALMIIASGVLGTGYNSLDLTSSAYETVFGSYGSWIVTFLSLTFGSGVLVSYSYITTACWLYLTNGRYEIVGKMLFCGMAFFGSLSTIEIVWNLTDLANAGLLIVNLCGILWLLPVIRSYLQKHKHI